VVPYRAHDGGGRVIDHTQRELVPLDLERNDPVALAELRREKTDDVGCRSTVRGIVAG
jgi:hypothetical protein